MKNILIFCLMLISNIFWAQDWCGWNFTYRFSVNNSSEMYHVLGIDFYIDDQHFLLNSMNRNPEKKVLIYDSKTNQYTLNMEYGCISCGYSFAKEPPDLYLKIKLQNYAYDVPFETFLPVYIEKKTGQNESWMLIPIEIGTINLSEFVDEYFDPASAEHQTKYEVIEVKKDSSVRKYKKGQFMMKRMGKMIKLEIEEEKNKL